MNTVAIVGNALLGQHNAYDVVIAGTRDRPDTVTTIFGVPTGVIVARTNRPAFATWLVATLHAILDEASPETASRSGELVECGFFLSEGAELWAWSGACQ